MNNATNFKSLSLEGAIQNHYRIGVFDGVDLEVLNQTSKDLPESFSVEYVKIDKSYGEDQQKELADVIVNENLDGMIIRSKTYATTALDDSRINIQFVGRAGIGVNNINLMVASKNGIYVCNAPDSNSSAVAELNFAQLFMIERHVEKQCEMLKIGDPDNDGRVTPEWEAKVKHDYKGQELGGKTLGIIGPGFIGNRVVPIARGLNMDVIVHDKVKDRNTIQTEISDHMESIGLTFSQSRFTIAPKDEGLVDLLSKSDYVVVHIPLFPATVGYIGAAEIERMKDGAVLINNSRERIVDEAAVKAALESGKLRAYITDVLTHHNPDTGIMCPLRDDLGRSIDGVYTTPHIGANTEESQYNAAAILATQSINSYIISGGKEIVNSVNFPTLSETDQHYYNLARIVSAFGTKYLASQERQITKVSAIGRGIQNFNRAAGRMACAAGVAYGLGLLVDNFSDSDDKRKRDMPAESILLDMEVKVSAGNKDAPKTGEASLIEIVFELEGSSNQVIFSGTYNPRAKNPDERYISDEVDSYSNQTNISAADYLVVDHSNQRGSLADVTSVLCTNGFNIEGIGLKNLFRRDGETYYPDNSRKMMVFPVRQDSDGPERIDERLMTMVEMSLNKRNDPDRFNRIIHVDLTNYTHTFNL